MSTGPHGLSGPKDTPRRYWDGCRCDECVQAMYAYNRTHPPKALRREPPPPRGITPRATRWSPQKRAEVAARRRTVRFLLEQALVPVRVLGEAMGANHNPVNDAHAVGWHGRPWIKGAPPDGAGWRYYGYDGFDPAAHGEVKLLELIDQWRAEGYDSLGSMTLDELEAAVLADRAERLRLVPSEPAR